MAELSNATLKLSPESLDEIHVVNSLDVVLPGDVGD